MQSNSVGNRLSSEISKESIQALEEQIRGRERAVVDLKRTRNSLLHVFKLPHEVLGNVFRWNVIFKDDFDGLGRESHNFLFVCHRWHEVAMGTPELWSFWGNTLADWARWSRRSGTAPLDLVLERDSTGDFDDEDSDDNSSDDGSLDAALSSVLRDRASRDTIRRIHLRSADPELLCSIISQLTPDEDRFTNVESFILHVESNYPIVDISDFLIHHRFPKLQRLNLFNCTISSWDLLKSRAPVLTTLDLHFRNHPSTPTTSQLLSVLASCPTVQKVTLSWSEDPKGGDGALSPRASLHHLKELKLVAPVRNVFGLLDRLELPRNMDFLNITLTLCSFDDVEDIVGPHLGEYLQHRGRSQNGLGLPLEPFDIDRRDVIVLCVSDVDEIDFFVPARPRMNRFMLITINLTQMPSPYMDLHLAKKAISDLITHAPREEVVYFQTYDRVVAMKDVRTLLPNLKGLHFTRAPMWDAFPESLYLGGDGEIFPFLQCVLIDGTYFGHHITPSDVDWSSLITFLDHRVASGNRLHTLVIFGFKSPPREDVERTVQVYAHITRQRNT